MSKELFFFATKKDLLQNLVEFEKYFPVKYYRNGLFSCKDSIIEYPTITDIDNIGFNISGNHQSESYLIINRHDTINVREVQLERGGIKYSVSQINNDNSIVLWPGGLFKEKYIICGHINTTKLSSIAIELLNNYIKYLKKGYKKVKSFYVGPEAMTLKDTHRFITMGYDQPEEFDLKIL